ncbi:hypothetical protein PLESTB_001432000 [Pleodorina starrii]|uniref:Uncharacterized protein n=1 Tax=Pleodorina starrii TaxID=330485 RepID=A0A9W6BVJ6_9CHLO|nr:hypothetical protein PLESTB_001432000 [Pleodorina starrii]
MSSPPHHHTTTITNHAPAPPPPPPDPAPTHARGDVVCVPTTTSAFEPASATSAIATPNPADTLTTAATTTTNTTNNTTNHHHHQQPFTNTTNHTPTPPPTMHHHHHQRGISPEGGPRRRSSQRTAGRLDLCCGGEPSGGETSDGDAFCTARPSGCPRPVAFPFLVVGSRTETNAGPPWGGYLRASCECAGTSAAVREQAVRPWKQNEHESGQEANGKMWGMRGGGHEGMGVSGGRDLLDPKGP